MTRSHDDEVVRLIAECQPRLYAYIRGLVLDRSLANDLLQSANVVLWTKRQEFTLGTDFGAWAFRVAYFEVRAFRKRLRSDRLVYDDDLLAEMAEEVAGCATELSRRRQFLDACLALLPEHHRALLLKRYEPTTTISELAHQQKSSVAAVSQLLYRLRHQLLRCIEAKLEKDGLA